MAKEPIITVNVNDAIRHYNRNRGTKPKMTQTSLAAKVFAGEIGNPLSRGYYLSKWSDGDYKGVQMANVKHIVRIVHETKYPIEKLLSIQ